MPATQTIRGAVLTRMGAEAPYAQSRPIAVEELELTGPGPGELLVRIEAAGLCHSDLSVVNGSRPRPLPMLLGHEAAGIVEEVGDGVTVAPGQRVVMTFLPRCGECPACATEGRLPCERGSAANGAGTLLTGARHLTRPGSGEVVQHHLGVSGFATHAVVDERSVVPVGADVPPAIAALLGCAVLTGGGALLNAGHIRPGATVAIVGLGGVGMAGLLTALGMGCRVIAVDAQESKLATALEWGAAEALTPAEAIERKVEAGVVLEAVGHPRAFETAYRLLGLGGTLVTVGLPAPGAVAEIEPLQLTAKAQTVVGSYLGSAVPKRDVPAFEALWRDGRLPLDRLVSRTIALEEINEGMDALASGGVIRQVVTFDAG